MTDAGTLTWRMSPSCNGTNLKIVRRDDHVRAGFVVGGWSSRAHVLVNHEADERSERQR